jgi:hypothetical protein
MHNVSLEVNKLLCLISEVDLGLSFTHHSCGSKDKLMISKSSIAVFFAFLFCQRLYFFHICLHVIAIMLTVDYKLSSFALAPVQSQNPHTFVVITLDPPIRKGQTLYPHIVIQVLYKHSIFTLTWIKF